MEGSVLVIGGGIAGIQCSLDLTELGYKVYLIEREASIGGHMAQFDKLFPANDCSLCVLAPRMVAIYKSPNIELLTLSEVTNVSGSVGNFEATIIKHPRYINESKCRGCGDCAAKCPKIEAPNPFDMNLGKRKSVYMPFPQATPPVYMIDPELCLYINRGVCGVCQKVCEAKAINFEQKPQEIKINVGAIVLATGFDMLGEELSDRWGYQYKNVVNSLEFERIICPTGPFGGNILRPSDEKPPEKIVFIQCAGSGYSEDQVPYCSRVCCMYTTKNAIQAKQYSEDMEVSVFRHNIRVFGRDFYGYSKMAQDDYQINYFTSTVDLIKDNKETDDLIINFHDLKTGASEEFLANMVVLAAPLVPSKGTVKLSKILNIERDPYNFYKSKSYFDNTSSTREGIFLCQGPMSIPETVSHASGVAGQVAMMLHEVKYTNIDTEVGIIADEDIIKITPKALIIGGGISGMTTALNIASQGFEVVLIEKEDRLGGNLKYLNVLSPTLIRGSTFLKDLKDKIINNTKINVHLKTKLLNVEGSIGNYNIKYSNKKINEETVGVIIVATGGQEFKPVGQFEYKKENSNVLTLLELEKRLDEDASWLKKIRHITVILCVKSRQKDGFSYCSNVCCSNAIKNIKILKELNPNVEILVLFRDLHMAKREFEEIFSERKNIANYMHYDLDNIPEITRLEGKSEKYQVKLKDDLDPSNILDFRTDLIVLATPLIPPEGIKELSDIINIPVDDNGFFIEAHTKLRPLDFAGHGIFICGCAQWPKNIQDSISQANGAAGRASRFLNIEEITKKKLEFLSFMISIECFFKDMKVNPDKCNGCGRCVDVCSFKAISLSDTKKEFEDVSLATKKAHINPAICKGCGRCAATCRLKAIDARHYDFDQISSIIDPYFLKRGRSEGDSKDEKEVIIVD